MNALVNTPYYRCGTLQISTNRVNRCRKTAIYTIRDKESVKTSINKIANDNQSLIVYRSSNVCTKQYKKYDVTNEINNVASNIYNDVENLTIAYPEDTVYIMGCNDKSVSDILFLTIH